jgi:hypothetical protein
VTFADFLHWIGAAGGAGAASTIAALYRRFMVIEATARDFAALVRELQAFPAETRDLPAPTYLAALKRYIDALRAQLAVPIVQATAHAPPRPSAPSGLSYKDAQKLAEMIRRVEGFEKELLELTRRVSSIEDGADADQEDQRNQWKKLGEDLAWLRGKLNLPPV